MTTDTNDKTANLIKELRSYADYHETLWPAQGLGVVQAVMRDAINRIEADAKRIRELELSRLQESNKADRYDAQLEEMIVSNNVFRAQIAELEAEVAGLRNAHFTLLREQNTTRCIEWMEAPPSLENISFHALELGGECGEAQNICKKIDRHRMEIPGALSPKEGKPMLGEELADVIICCDMVASIFNIDLWHEVCRKFNKTSSKHGFNTMLPPKPTAKSGEGE